jgi:hypothetical protein
LAVEVEFWTGNYVPGQNSVRFDICGPAGRGTNAPALYNPSWFVSMDPIGLYYTVNDQVMQLQQGLWYMTLTTTGLPNPPCATCTNGETRGQLRPLQNRFFRLKQ